MSEGDPEGKRQRPVLIGLTGTYCAGKNYVAALLEERGFLVLDVDKLGHQALEEEKNALAARFGPQVLTPEGSVDRRSLGNLVFGNREGLMDLEKIVHPAANRLTEEWIRSNRDRPLAVNAALLHRSSVFQDLDFIILVQAPWPIRLLRALRRDKLPLFAILKRFNSQRRFKSQYFKKKADIHIVNNRGYFRCRARHDEGAAAQRIDAILAREGMVR